MEFCGKGGREWSRSVSAWLMETWDRKGKRLESERESKCFTYNCFVPKYRFGRTSFICIK